MKKLIYILLHLVAINSAFANQIDEATAKTVAVHFLMTKTSHLNNNLSALTLANTVSDNAQPFFYIFNIAFSNGFVIVSADDNVNPILGYSYESSFNPSNIPIQLTDWLQKRKAEIAYVKNSHLQANDAIKTTWRELINPPKQKKYQLFGSASTVSPLLHTTWNQSPYYNALCPGGSLTGCVATAMAQIMKYWNYPSKGTGFHSYTPPNASLGVQSVNFSDTTYHWNLMPNSISASSSLTEINEVAKLMYTCGVAINMQFSTSESLAYMYGGGYDAQYAFKSFFGYNDSLKGLTRSNYVDADWLNLIQGELNVGRPLLWDGRGPDNSSHCFVADGYDANNYIHFNWGWGGQANGYFNIDALNPGPYPAGFNINERVIIGIRPTFAHYNLSLSSAVTVPSTQITYGKPIAIKTNIINTGDSSFKGDFCAAIFDTSSNFTNYIQLLASQTLLSGASYPSGITFTNLDSAKVAPGTYSVYIYYRKPGGNWENLISNDTFPNYVKVTVQQIGVVPPTTVYKTVKQSICASQLPYLWNGNWYTQSGNYSYTSNAINDTVTVSTLVLSVKNPSYGTKTVNLCSGKLPYVWNGVAYTTPGTYTKMLTNSVGCDSTAILELNVIYPTSNVVSLVGCGSVIYNGKTYTKSKVLSDTLRTFQGCDSVYQIVNITVNKILIPSVSIATNTDTIPCRTSVTFTATPVNNGTTTIFQWRRNSNYINGASGNTYTFDSLHNGDTISCLLITVNSCGSISTIASNRIIIKVLPKYLLSGNFTNPMGVSISQVSVGLNDADSVFSGNYKFFANPNNNYTLHPFKNTDTYPSNGVSVKDILLIQAHLLGKTLLNSPYKIIAADVNNDGQVTVLDILYMKRLIMGLDTCFPNNRLWAFVDSSYQFPHSSTPFPFKDTISFNNLSTSQLNKNFVGIKLGDVDFDWNPAVLSKPSLQGKQLGLSYKSKALGNAFISVSVTVKDFTDIAGMQFTLNYDNTLFRFLTIKNSQPNLQFTTDSTAKGKIAFLWSDDYHSAHSLADSTVLMELVFVRLSNSSNPVLHITSDIAPVEAYNTNLQPVRLGMNALDADRSVATEFWSISPNPSVGPIVITLFLNQSKSIQFELEGADGNVLFQQTTIALSGKNTLSLNLNKNARLPKGVYYLKAIGVDGGEVKKVMIK